MEDTPTQSVPHFQLHCKSNNDIIYCLWGLGSSTTNQFRWQVYDLSCGKHQWFCMGDVNVCFKYNSHSWLRKSLRWRWSNFFHVRWKEFQSLARRPPWEHQMWFLVMLGCKCDFTLLVTHGVNAIGKGEACHISNLHVWQFPPCNIVFVKTSLHMWCFCFFQGRLSF